MSFRTLLASALVLAVTLTAAATPAATQTAATLSGTFAGRLTPEGGGDPIDGRIVIVERGEAVEVMLGPSADEMMPATNVKRTGQTLTFEADAPSDTPNHLVFEVTIAGDTLTGALTQTRDGQTRTARLAFIRQPQ
jgi:hypothetical protein